jgi:prenyltransferase beta subunit
MLKRKLMNWTLSLQNADGGFGHSQGQRSDVEATRFAIGIIQQIGKPVSIIRPVRSWLKSIEKRFICDSLERRSLRYIYYWVVAASAVGIQPVSANVLCRFILSLYRPNSTFASSLHKETGDLDSALYALRMLAQLGHKIPSYVTRSSCLFCLQCHSLTGGYGLIPRKPPNLNATYAAFNILRLLRKPVPNIIVLTKWIYSCGYEKHMFGSKPHGRCQLGPTYWAVQMLLKACENIDRDKICHHILDSHFLPNGGFSDSCNSKRPVAQIWPTYCAVNILYKLGIHL